LRQRWLDDFERRVSGLAAHIDATGVGSAAVSISVAVPDEARSPYPEKGCER
jgi:hypothetical protein